MGSNGDGGQVTTTRVMVVTGGQVTTTRVVVVTGGHGWTGHDNTSDGGHGWTRVDRQDTLRFPARSWHVLSPRGDRSW